jgi:hypothetical protein
VFRRANNLATASDPVIGGREAKYILDVTDPQAEIVATLRRIRDRDGTRYPERK